MAAKGYSSPGSVGNYLGTVLTAEGTAQANICLEAAEQRIDAYTGRAWLTGVITNERVPVDGPFVYLQSIPVSSVGTVTGRTYASTVTTALVADTDYETGNLAQGQLIVSPRSDPWAPWAAWPRYDYLLVSYTPGTAVPMGVALATTMLAARYLQPSITEFSDAIEKTAGDVTLRYDPKRAQEALPAQVMDLLAAYRRSFVA